MGLLLVNMIPKWLSNETECDSEPNLAVNPAFPLLLAASAFTPDPMKSTTAPIFVSSDGGSTWDLATIVPAGGPRTSDITLRFATSTNMLYAAILRPNTLTMDILRTDASSLLKGKLLAVMTTLVERGPADQPWVEAATAIGGTGTGRDHVYVGNNDLTVRTTTGHTAAIDVSLDAALTSPPSGFASPSPIHIETRGFDPPEDWTAYTHTDGPSIRPAIHPDGTIYSAFFGYRWSSNPIKTDVVVVRDDRWGEGNPLATPPLLPFSALVDPADGLAGRRAVVGTYLLAQTEPPTLLGTQRIGSSLALAVDPSDSKIVYLAWADGDAPSTYTIRLRRSIDGGATWSTDLRAIPMATNPSLALTTQGTVGFLYQKFIPAGGGTASGARWQTHLERSSDGFASTPKDLLLANVPDENGSYIGHNPLGDYACLLGVGKDFYGVFSANNTPNPDHFPAEVRYQRQAAFSTTAPQLLDLANNPVPVSIDPFFFKVTLEEADDFYVRDWTENASAHDTGLEPSTNPNFFTTSDVWNRHTNAPGPFVNDQPQNEDVQVGAGAAGTNYTFVRIHRKAPAASGSTPVTVKARFFFAEFGTGASYVMIGTTSVTFAAADVVQTVGLPWHRDNVASPHVCLAVEIAGPNDRYATPSLLGNTPGWFTGTDLRVISDNNKAQRNMGAYSTAIGGAGTASFYAAVQNGATLPRSLELRYEATPEVQARLRNARIEVIGGESRPFRSGDMLRLDDMQPGEYRWVGVTFEAPDGKEGEELPMLFYEMDGHMAVNGFTIAARPSSVRAVLRANLAFHRAVFTRLAAAFHIDRAQAESEAAQRLLDTAGVGEQGYAEFLREHTSVMAACFADFHSSQRAGDPFGVQAAQERLADVVHRRGGCSALLARLGAARQRSRSSDRQRGAQDATRAATAHAALLHKLDAFLTMQQKAQGDPADILLNVRWHKDLCSKVPQVHGLPSMGAVMERCQAFIHAYAEGAVHDEDYPGLIRSLLDPLRATARAPELAQLELEPNVTELARHLEALPALQKAHRAYLGKLQRLAP